MGMRGLIMTDAFQGTVAYVFSAVLCVMLLSGVAGDPISIADLERRRTTEYLVLPGDGDKYGPLLHLRADLHRRDRIAVLANEFPAHLHRAPACGR